MKQVSPSRGLIALVKSLALCPVFVGHSITHAQSAAESPATAPFDAITIQGESAAMAAPWGSETTRQELDALQIQNWSDFARRAEPGVNFNETSKSINVRGLDQNRVLTRIDGIRQTWLKDPGRGVRGGLNTFDFNSLSAIDIVRGADSSVAGSGAMGGVVDLRTLNPNDLLGDGKSFGSLLKAGYNSVDQSGLASAAIAGKASNSTQWLVQAGIQKGSETINMGTVGGYGVSRTEPNPDDYLQQNYLLKVQSKFDGGHTLGLSGSYFDRQDKSIDMAAAIETYAPGQSRLTDTSRRESVALDYGWVAPNGNALVDLVDAQIYWQRVNLSSNLAAMRIATPGGNYARNNSLQESTYGINTLASKALSGSVSQLWKLGAEWYGNTTEQWSTGQDTCPARFSPYSPCNFLRTNQADMPEVNGSQVGVWLQNTLGFSENLYTLTPAVRYDYYQQTPKDSSSFQSNVVGGQLPGSSTGSAVSPKLLGTWSPAANASLYAQYAFGFNAPTATQLYSKYGAPGTYLVTGNPNLKPETSQGWELGTKLGDDSLNGALTYFDNSYKNFIETVNSPGTATYPYFVQSYENLESVRIYGVEAKGSWKFAAGWRAYGSLAWAEGKNQNTGQYLNSVAPLTAIAGVAYSQNQWGATAQVTAVAARNNVAYPEATASMKYADFQAPGYGIADLTAYWKPAEVKGLWLQAGVYNVFNKTYWNALNVPTAGSVAIPRAIDFYTSPGRSFQASLIYQY